VDTLMMHCKVCDTVKEDCTYSDRLKGWQCFDCHTGETGKFDVSTLREQAVLDLNPLDDQPLRQTMRRHLAHLETL
jgi:hypothetical protein